MADLPDVGIQAIAPGEALARIWADLGLDAGALARVDLTGAEPVFETAFAVGTAAQVSIAALALAATEIDRARHPEAPQRTVTVDLAAAARETTSHFTVDGVSPPTWDPISGLYRCGRASDPDRAAGWVRIHANFPHHRAGAIHLLGLGGRPEVSREDIGNALAQWRAEDVEDAASELGLPIVAFRTRRQWSSHPQAAIVRGQPLIAIEQIGDAPPRPWPSPRHRPSGAPNGPDGPGFLDGPGSPGSPGSQRHKGSQGEAPLAGLRVLDLTRVLAGPVGCRALATLGADVLTVHSPGLPNINAWPDTSRGKRSAQIDFVTEADRLRSLVTEADVFFESARPGAIEAAGFGPRTLHRLRPGIVAVSLDAWGDQGPWGNRRGFDSLVQTATGLNDDERLAFGATAPRPLPVQILDHAAGYLAACGALVALLRQRQLGGSWRVHVSLARTALWLRSLGRLPPLPGPAPHPTADLTSDLTSNLTSGPAPGAESGPRPEPTRATTGPALAAALRAWPSDFGELRGLPHAARFSRPWPEPGQPSRLPGSDPPRWW